jgi:hypothetical protein
LKVIAEAPKPVSRIIVAGAAALVDDALADVVGDASWFSQAISGQGFEFELHGISLAERGDEASRLVGEVFASTPELADWTWEVGESAPPDVSDDEDEPSALAPDTPDDLVADLSERVVDDLVRSLRSEEEVLKHADLFRAVDLKEVFVVGSIGGDDLAVEVADLVEERVERLVLGGAVRDLGLGDDCTVAVEEPGEQLDLLIAAVRGAAQPLAVDRDPDQLRPAFFFFFSCRSSPPRCGRSGPDRRPRHPRQHRARRRQRAGGWCGSCSPTVRCSSLSPDGTCSRAARGPLGADPRPLRPSLDTTSLPTSWPRPLPR